MLESRTVAWGRRPQAALVIAALSDPDRGWDAIVVGEYERAFYGSQYAMVAPLLQHYGVQLWMPGASGRVDFASEHDEQAMTHLGLSSKREIARTSIRGPYRDGHPGQRTGPLPRRPPTLRVPAGRCRAAPEQGPRLLGRRAHRLEPNPETSHLVRWIFAQRLAGRPVARIARH